MWERKTITELTGCHSPTWEVKNRCLTRGEYFIVSYFLIFSIKIIDGGRGGNDTLANGNLRKYYLQEYTHPMK